MPKALYSRPILEPAAACACKLPLQPGWPTCGMGSGCAAAHCAAANQPNAPAAHTRHQTGCATCSMGRGCAAAHCAAPTQPNAAAAACCTHQTPAWLPHLQLWQRLCCCPLLSPTITPVVAAAAFCIRQSSQPVTCRTAYLQHGQLLLLPERLDLCTAAPHYCICLQASPLQPISAA